MLLQESEIKHHFPDFPGFSQINLIEGKRNSLRGIHAARPVDGHWKVVTCLKGRVRDAVLDLRFGTPTFGKINWIDLDAADQKIVVIPPGFGHAVQSLTESSITIYGTNIEYANNKEFEIYPMCEEWEGIWESSPILSKRDSEAPVFKLLTSNGFFG